MRVNDIWRNVVKSLSMLPFVGTQLMQAAVSQESQTDVAPFEMALDVVQVFNTLELPNKMKFSAVSRDSLL